MINDRLACLVGKAMELLYIVPVHVVWAWFGANMVGFNHLYLGDSITEVKQLYTFQDLTNNLSFSNLFVVGMA